MRNPPLFYLYWVQHVEFFHKEHFEKKYHRVSPPDSLKAFIDFFWETRFENLWAQHPNGFSDVLFPNLGYTYLINLGTPFIMQVAEKKFSMKTDGFLPRHKALECYHQPGNKIFGIKFRISPLLLQRRINFAEYKEYIFPLSYLFDKAVISKIKKAPGFDGRVKIASAHFESFLKNKKELAHKAEIVSSILERCSRNNDFTASVEELAKEFGISSRTLQRYFETSISISSKKALQILRIRKAVEQLANSPADFHFSNYGYYDASHFYKHLRQFVQKKTLVKLKPHLKLLELKHKAVN